MRRCLTVIEAYVRRYYIAAGSLATGDRGMDDIGETLHLPGFSPPTNPSRPKAQKLAREANSLDGLAALVGRFIPAEIFEPEDGQRRRVFPPWVTFIAFLGQVLSRGSACRESV